MQIVNQGTGTDTTCGRQGWSLLVPLHDGAGMCLNKMSENNNIYCCHAGENEREINYLGQSVQFVKLAVRSQHHAKLKSPERPPGQQHDAVT